MVKKTTNYKKKYYGKYYNSKQISNMLRNWGKYKISSTWFIKRDGQRYSFQSATNTNLMYPQNMLGNFLSQGSTWTVVTKEWTFWKITGVLFELSPVSQTAYVLNNGIYEQWKGNVAIGLMAQGGYDDNLNNWTTYLAAYPAIIESDKCIQLDTTNKQRVYFPIRERDFRSFPVNAEAGVAPNIPLFLHVNSMQIAGSDHPLYPVWSCRLTFYITCKDRLV